ncbi:TetR family transcriptional regulator [Bailinhaonella thermotolerans]|uniref:TetR/AcrR family transcriptional regulator n=1 Tax=Bailinhaonella thermotolerans TaxID=1070861 RepID=A0A3A4A797_9ACTN|nr:TetR family transcriptional regulator [Bailinhaonella thermotolerans]RJL20825.1 TetR/AcrR family transcriptional regulator [Bailinhaonella thermotolerans]
MGTPVRTLRDELLTAAEPLLIERGYRNLRMRDVADAVGVSRQTVYNEFGDKWGLAQALALKDNERFLDGIDEALSAHDDLYGAVRAAVLFTLEEAASDPLTRTVLTGDGSEGLLPLLTTRAEPLLLAANQRIVRHARAKWPELPADELAVITESVVRLTVSHILLPTRDDQEVADSLARLVLRYLGLADRDPAAAG